MRGNSLNMSHRTSFCQNGRQSIHNEVEHDRGEWISLPHSPGVAKVRSNLAVDVDVSLTSLDQLHQAVHNTSREPLSEDYLLKEFPANSVIHLLEVEFEKQTLFLPDSEFMGNLV
jgi:hypothetical protein